MSEIHPVLQLPTSGKLLTQKEVDLAYQRARAAYDRNRESLEAYPKGTLILIDGDDQTGKSFTAGDDITAIEQEHFRKYRKVLHTSCFFRVGEV